jgi:hypothetical protein
MAENNQLNKAGEKNQDGSQDFADKARMNGCYKEINDYRRHYSHLRFALFPIYLTTQYGLIRIYIQPLSGNICMPQEILIALTGMLITYVFWTIEKRIISYYNYLKNMGSEMEANLGYRLISDWPQDANKNIIRNTEFSISITFIIAAIFWISTICTYIFSSEPF